MNTNKYLLQTYLRLPIDVEIDMRSRREDAQLLQLGGVAGVACELVGIKRNCHILAFCCKGMAESGFGKRHKKGSGELNVNWLLFSSLIYWCKYRILQTPV